MPSLSASGIPDMACWKPSPLSTIAVCSAAANRESTAASTAEATCCRASRIFASSVLWVALKDSDVFATTLANLELMVAHA